VETKLPLLASVWDLFHVSSLVLRILKLLPGFGKFVCPWMKLRTGRRWHTGSNSGRANRYLRSPDNVDRRWYPHNPLPGGESALFSSRIYGKNQWRYNLTPSYKFMACMGTSPSDHLTFKNKKTVIYVFHTFMRVIHISDIVTELFT
jgi:hypothetical protein